MSNDMQWAKNMINKTPIIKIDTVDFFIEIDENMVGVLIFNLDNMSFFDGIAIFTESISNPIFLSKKQIKILRMMPFTRSNRFNEFLEDKMLNISFKLF